MRPIIPTTAAPAASGLTPRQLSFVLYFNAEESRQLIARLYEAERDLEKFTSSKHNREEHVAKAKETAALFLEIHEKHNQTWYLKKEAEERKGKGEVIDTDGFLEWSVELPWKNNLRCPCGYGHPRPKGEGNVLK